jgi:hypothetical protein
MQAELDKHQTWHEQRLKEKTGFQTSNGERRHQKIKKIKIVSCTVSVTTQLLNAMRYNN